MTEILFVDDRVQIKEELVKYRKGRKMTVKIQQGYREEEFKVEIIEFNGEDRAIASRSDFVIPLEFAEQLANVMLEYVRKKGKK